MPVPNLGLKVDYDNQKVKFLMISGRPETNLFRPFRCVPGQLTINNAPDGSCVIIAAVTSPPVRPEAVR